MSRRLPAPATTLPGGAGAALADAPAGRPRLLRAARRARAALLLAVSAALLTAAVVPAAGGAERPSRGDLPARGAAARGAGPSTQPGGEAAGGTYVTPGGEQVQVLSSAAQRPDEARNQAWADFLGRLAHGPELSTATLYLAPLDEVQAICGGLALACYTRSTRRIVAPIEDVWSGPTAEELVAHEYGHHVAASRLNAPWETTEWGTKRWATYLGVCDRVASGALFPGDRGELYRLNPGEAFAESYRVLNERLAGRPESPWRLVSHTLHPDARALELLLEDIVHPWLANGSLHFRDALGPGKGRYRFTVETPLDGELRLTLHPPPGADFELALYDFATRRLLVRATGPLHREISVRETVCGQRAFLAVVRRRSGSGSFTVDVSRP